MRFLRVKREWKFSSSLLPYWVIIKGTKADFMVGHGFSVRYGLPAFHVAPEELDRLGIRVKNGRSVPLFLDNDQTTIFVCSRTGVLSNEISVEGLANGTTVTLTTKGGFTTPSYPVFKEPKSCDALSAEDLLALDDDGLFGAILGKIEAKLDKYDDPIEAARDVLSGPERTVYVASYYETQVDNGGLCQFFVYEHGFAPEVAEHLGKIGALEHKNRYESFLSDNGINPYTLSYFDDSRDFSEMEAVYPFYTFDDAFDKPKPIFDYLIAYIRQHISEF